MPVTDDDRAALPAEVKPRDRDRWINWHRNVEQTIDGYFDIANVAGATLATYNAATANIQSLLRVARRRGVPLRPFGGAWSFSDAPASPGWMVDTAYLNLMFPMSDRLLHPRFAGRNNELFFVQAGARISEINQLIEQRHGRSFATTGASNGQTIAGAIGTGTHGSAIDHSALHGQVLGLHVVTSEDTHVWLERDSRPATRNDAFANAINARLIRDDATFDASLVSFGGMGFVAGVMIETVPIFRLSASRDWRPWSDPLKAAVGTLDFDGYDLPGVPAGQRPYFVMPVVNAFDLDKVSVTAMHALPYNGEPIDYTRNRRDRRGPGIDLLNAIGTATDLTGTPPALINLMARTQLAPFGDRIGTWGETFDFVQELNGTIGASVAVDLSDAPRAVDALIDEMLSGRAAALAFALRFVRHANATLEFTRFPVTCVIDMDGVHNDTSLAFYARAYARLEREGIAFTQHWGKYNNYTATNVRDRFGDAPVDAFLAARDRLLPDAELKAMFATPFLERAGLA